MPNYGPWTEQDDLVGSATLSPSHQSHDWSDALRVNIPASTKKYGGRTNGDNSFDSLANTWNETRGATPFATHARSTGEPEDWYAGVVLRDDGPSFGWTGNLVSWSFQVDLRAWNEPRLLDWPEGAVGWEVEGPQFWDVRLEPVGTLDTGDRTGASPAPVEGVDLFRWSPGTVRAVNADIAQTQTYPQELLASEPDVSAIEFADVAVTNEQFTGTRVSPILNMLASATPPSMSPPASSPWIFHQFTYTYVIDVDVTVVRPRYRWIYSEPLRTKYPLRRWPVSNGAMGPVRHYPPPESRRKAGGYK